MARKKKGRAINGVILVDKSEGVSSNHVVQRVKRLYKAQKAGHTGALDPLATGVLPVCLGEATKFSQYLLDSDKHYFVTGKLGERTDTSDAEGTIVETREVDVGEHDIKQLIPKFMGNIKQVPSMFSALKHQGKPLYYYARQGIEIERPARDITVYDIAWRGIEGNHFSLDVHCSKGTYIRTLVDDIGQTLGCGAHVTVLRRTGIGHYKNQSIYTIDDLETRCSDNDESNTEFSALDELLLPIDACMSEIPIVLVSDYEASRYQQGQPINASAENCSESEFHNDGVRVYRKSDNTFLGTAIHINSNTYQPKRVVVY